MKVGRGGGATFSRLLPEVVLSSWEPKVSVGELLTIPKTNGIRFSFVCAVGTVGQGVAGGSARGATRPPGAHRRYVSCLTNQSSSCAVGFVRHMFTFC